RQAIGFRTRYENPELALGARLFISNAEQGVELPPRLDEQFLVVGCLDFFADQLDVVIAPVASLLQSTDQLLQGYLTFAQRAAVLITIAWPLAVAQMNDGDLRRPFGESLEHGRVPAEVISVEGQLQGRTADGMEQLERLVRAGEKGPIGRTFRMHRFDGQLHT